ncbi:MAG: thioredoxin domain-containing protein [Hydrogenobacter thermophilus]|nr:MAG: thioredoxin domain-containing protein [Hydrogenobacter thermophilus]
MRMPNRLINARSPYLRKSAYQPVDWYEWCEEAFEKAKREDKPVLLSIGGVWCHWCHVMAKESFEDPEIAKIINENFVAIKVDRDERPDIDRRYQDTVIALTGSGGWPLTAFLTPDGKLFFGGTYFPPEDRWGRPGLKSLLLRISQLWREEKERILKSADHIFLELQNYSSMTFKDFVDEELLKRGIGALLSSVDYEKGGIGSAPKFHHSKAFELLLYHYHFTKEEIVKRAIISSLDAMAKGGIYDHLLGGFFRYSTDDTWNIPHFEKMLYDNTELLRLYSLAYQVFENPLYEYVAKGIVNYYKLYGSDPEGGFYASQDADIGVLDEGGHYTFSSDELESLLDPEELKVVKLYFGIDTKGRMPHHQNKNVLFINMDVEHVSKVLNISKEKTEELLKSAKEKMLNYRNSREIPYIDKTIYTSWNGLMIDALCVYYKVFQDEWSLLMAEKTANRLIKERYRDGSLDHADGVSGYSEDYIYLSQGLLSLFEITQNRTYLDMARELLDKAIELFWDDQGWGFFDTHQKGEGLLLIKHKPIQDTPTQSVNGTSPYLLLLMEAITGDTKYGEYAEKNLMAFSRFMREMPMASHSYFLSLYAYLKGIFKVETEKYFEEALYAFRPFKLVVKGHVEGLLVCEGKVCKSYSSPEEIEL